MEALLDELCQVDLLAFQYPGQPQPFQPVLHVPDNVFDAVVLGTILYEKMVRVSFFESLTAGVQVHW